MVCALCISRMFTSLYSVQQTSDLKRLLTMWMLWWSAVLNKGWCINPPSRLIIRKRATFCVVFSIWRCFFVISKNVSCLFFPSEQQPPRVAAGRLGESQTHHGCRHPRSPINADPDDGDRVLGHLQPGRTFLEQCVRGELPKRKGTQKGAQMTFH